MKIMKFIALMGILVTFSSCSKVLVPLAKNVLYQWDSINKRLDVRNSKQPPPTAEVVDLTGGGHAWMSNRKDGNTTLLYLHGNGLSVVDLLDGGFTTHVLDRSGYNWAMIDYPGIGIGGNGEPSEKSLVSMAESALNELLRRVKPETKVIVWGRSLGAAVAAQVAMKHKNKIHKLILISPWTRFEHAAKNNWMGRFIPDSFIKENSFKTDEACKSIDTKTLLVHGTADKLISFDHSKALKSCFKNSTLHTATGLGHNDIYIGDVLSVVRGFIENGGGR